MNVFFYPEDDNDCELIESVAKQCLKVLRQKKYFDVEISFVDDEQIRLTNLSERGKDCVTDVLSFPTLDGVRERIVNKKDYVSDVNPETNNIMLGSIMICKKRASEQAIEYAHSLKREIAYLALHGLLHLFGYDHETEQDKKQMREKEEKVLEKLKIRRD